MFFCMFFVCFLMFIAGVFQEMNLFGVYCVVPAESFGCWVGLGRCSFVASIPSRWSKLLSVWFLDSL